MSHRFLSKLPCRYLGIQLHLPSEYAGGEKTKPSFLERPRGAVHFQSRRKQVSCRQRKALLQVARTCDRGAFPQLWIACHICELCRRGKRRRLGLNLMRELGPE